MKCRRKTHQLPYAIVTLHARVWIEIQCRDGLELELTVPLRVRVWIEIAGVGYTVNVISSPSV